MGEGMRSITSSRFGSLSTDENELIVFEHGLLGMPNEREFLLIKHREASVIHWLQSARTPDFALPLVPAHLLAMDYPEQPLTTLAALADVPDPLDQIALLVVACFDGGVPTVNLVAPIVVGTESRRAAQVVVPRGCYGVREPFELWAPGTTSARPQMLPEQRGESCL